MPQNAPECTSEHLKFSSGACLQAPYSKGSLGSPMPPLTAIFSALANIFAPPPTVKKTYVLPYWSGNTKLAQVGTFIQVSA